MVARNEKATGCWFYQSLFQLSTNGCLTTDAEGLIQQVNPTATALLNESENSLRGKPFVHFLAKDERQTFQAHLARLQNNKSVQVKEWEVLVQPTGRPSFPAILTGAAVDDGEGQLIGLLWELRDITARKQIEHDLLQSQQRLQAIFDHTQDAILLANDAARYVDVNPTACTLLGYSREEFLTLNLWDLTPAVSRELGQRLWQEFLAEGALAGEYPLQCKDETTIVVDYRAVANIVPGLHLSVLRDVTERKQAEQEILHQRDRAKALIRRLAETQEIERKALSRELHDQLGQKLTGLNLNLNVIRGQVTAASAATQSTIQARLADSLTIIEEMGERVQDLLSELSPAVLNDYGLVAALQWYAETFASRVDFAVRVYGEEPAPRLAEAVELALFRITQEALTNVAKHAQASRATVTLGPKHGMVRLVIADDGHGFKPADRDQTSAKQKWGLLTMAERAEAVGGRCRIETQPGQGTRVIVDVPQSRAE